MKLEAEEVTIGDATPSDIEQLFDDAFDSFAILSTGPEDYIQTAGSGERDYQLEYRDSAAGKHYEAVEKLTQQKVKEAFLDYLSGGSAWKESRDWQELQL